MEWVSIDHRFILGDAPIELKECVSYLMTLKFSECNEVVDDNFKFNVGGTDTNNHDQGEQEDDETTCNQMSFNLNPMSPPISNTPREASAMSTPIATPEDPFWLSELQCYLRSDCCEFFQASASHKTSPLKKLTTLSTSNRTRIPVSEGRIGIRCTFCGHASYHLRAPQAISFPSSISGIYSAVVMMQLRHFPKCQLITEQARMKLEMAKRGTIAASSNNAERHPPPSSTRQQYWIDSARRLGLVDTEDGIRCVASHKFMDRKRLHHSVSSNLSENQHVNENLSSSSNSSKRMRKTVENCSNFDSPNRSTSLPDKSKKIYNKSIEKSTKMIPVVSPSVADPSELKYIDLIRRSKLTSLIGDSELVRIDDVDLVPDYLLIGVAQMVPCRFEEWDRTGCYKDRPEGFKGLCCKYCHGQQGHGKFFPSTVSGIAQTTTAQTILKHLAYKCEKCPEDVRQAVLKFEEDQSLKEQSKHSDINRQEKITTLADSKPRYGSRKFFFRRIWSRLHGETAPSSDFRKHNGMFNVPRSPASCADHDY